MNHTKTILTDILLHLRKRAERGDPVWRELAAREEAAYCRVRQLCGGDRELLQEVGDLSDACCALALGALDLLGAEEEEPLSHARALSCS